MMKKLLLILTILIIALVGCSEVDINQLTKKENVQLENSSKTSNSTDATSDGQIGETNAHIDVKTSLVRVVDGDTIVVNDGQEEFTVRFLLIDTPEMNSNNSKDPEPFAEESKQFLEDLISNQNVQLDIGKERYDHYGRTLAWAYVDGTSLQEKLLKNGLAKVRYVIEPNTKHVDKYRSIEQKARQSSIGIWSIPGYADNGEDYNVSAVSSSTNQSTQSIDDSCKIKGNINSDGEKIYHTTASQWYEQTKAEKMFCSEADAKASGFRKAYQN